MPAPRPISAGPALLPASLATSPVVSTGGGHVRAVQLAGDLMGHRAGTLHAGMVAAIALAAAQLEDPDRLPVTSLDGEVWATPQVELTTHARPVPSARHQVDVATGQHVTARLEIELAGHVPVSQLADLRELVTTPLPEIAQDRPSSTCVLCGPGGLLLRAVDRRDDVVEGVMSPGAESCESDTDDRVHLAVLLTALTCASAWMTGEEPSGLHLRLFGRPQAYEPLRVVAHHDAATGVRVIAADEDGVVYALLATTHGDEDTATA